MRLCRRSSMSWMITPASGSSSLKTWWRASVWSSPSTSRSSNKNGKQWERGRRRRSTWGGGQGGEKGREKGTGKFGRLQIDSGRLCHPVTSQHIHCNLFLPQHLADAKKAQQTLESSFKHLESVSQLVLFLTDVCDSSLKINSPKLLKNMLICLRMKPDLIVPRTTRKLGTRPPFLNSYFLFANGDARFNKLSVISHLFIQSFIFRVARLWNISALLFVWCRDPFTGATNAQTVH